MWWTNPLLETIEKLLSVRLTDYLLCIYSSCIINNGCYIRSKSSMFNYIIFLFLTSSCRYSSSISMFNGIFHFLLLSWFSLSILLNGFIKIFVKVWEWKTKYGGIIWKQLRAFFVCFFWLDPWDKHLIFSVVVRVDITLWAVLVPWSTSMFFLDFSFLWYFVC